MRGEVGKRKKEYIDSLKHEVKKVIREKGMEILSPTLEEVKREYISKISEFGVKDPEQSWRAFKGNLIEEIVLEYLQDFAKLNNLGLIKGTMLEKEDRNLDKCLAEVKRSLLVDFGEFGMHLPDADLVIYDRRNCKAIAIISSKATLRERIAQTGYWNLKIKQSEVTRNIKVFFVTPDEDRNLDTMHPAKKGRAIAEVDIDGTYVICDSSRTIQESNKVKKFEKFIEDLEAMIKENSYRR